jgi:putative chitinase
MLRVVRHRRVFQLATALTLVLALALSLMPTVAQASGCDHYYRVQQGDSLGSIANMFGTTASALARANGLSNPSLIRDGQKLCIVGAWTNHTGSAWAQPKHGGGHDNDWDNGHEEDWDNGKDNGYHEDWDKGKDDGHKGGHGGCFYVVQQGDTLSEIAKWHHISVKHLAWQNNIHNPSYIYTGQKLYVCK